MSLRWRISLAAAIASALVLVVAGALIVRLTERDQRSALDQQLASQAAVLAGPLTRVAGSAVATILQQAGATGIDGDRTVQVVSPAGTPTLTVGATLPASLGLVASGASTVVINGQRFRVYAVSGGSSRTLLRLRSGAAQQQVQVIAPLGPLQQQSRAIRRRVLTVGAGAVLAVVLMTWLFTGVALASLRRLRGMADEVATTEDLSLRLEPLEPPEVGDVVAAFNSMLARLDASATDRQRALDTARAFAADAMHELRTPLTSMGATLETLSAHHYGDDALVQAVAADHARVVGTLEALNALTVAELLPADREQVDLADVIELLANDSPRRHPGIAVTVILPPDPVMVIGAREALRMLLDNLLTNAERHGRSDGVTAVEIRTVRDGDSWLVTVDDDGRGFPAQDPNQLFSRFVRGAAADGERPPGSGLGLAIVAAQVHRHSGAVALGRSPLGGARVQLRLPVGTR
jgi:two-component system, OmpR family, sensor histidine kinase PrrB